MGLVAIHIACLVFTNLFFALPAATCFKKGLWYEASIYLAITIVSGVYHFVDRGSVQLPKWDYSFSWMGHDYARFETFYILDHYLSHVIIITTVFLLIHSTGPEVPDHRKNINRAIKTVTSTLLGLLILGFVIEKVNTEFLALYIVVFCILYMLGALFIFKVDLEISAFDFGLGMLFLAIAVSMFVIGGFYPFHYWIFHSFWHVFMAISLALFAESKKDTLDIPKYLTCGMASMPNTTYMMINTQEPREEHQENV